MILHALKDYYERKAEDASEALAPVGWESKEIPFVVVIDSDGGFVQLDDLRETEGKATRAKAQLVPSSVKRSVNIAANLLWDSIEYALGVDTRGKPERVRDQHAAFRQRLRGAFGEQPSDAGVKALYRFLDRFDERLVSSAPAWKEAKLRRRTPTCPSASRGRRYCSVSAERSEQPSRPGPRLRLTAFA